MAKYKSLVIEYSHIVALKTMGTPWHPWSFSWNPRCFFGPFWLRVLKNAIRHSGQKDIATYVSGIGINDGQMIHTQNAIFILGPLFYLRAVTFPVDIFLVNRPKEKKMNQMFQLN